MVVVARRQLEANVPPLVYYISREILLHDVLSNYLCVSFVTPSEFFKR